MKEKNVLEREMLVGRPKCRKKGCRKKAHRSLFGIGYCKDHLVSITREWVRDLEP